MDHLFFNVAKTGWLLVQPISIVLVVAVLAMLAGVMGRPFAAAALAACCAVLVYVCAYTTTGSVLLAQLEDRYPAKPVLDQPVAAIVVLGGGFDGTVTRARGGYALGASGDRFAEAAMLAHAHRGAKVIVSGGAASFVEQGEADATIAPRFFGRLGIGDDRLILEGKSMDTFENAQLTKPILADLRAGHDGVALLVTSAFHMPRSMAIFEAQGIDVVPWPVDFRTAGRGHWRIFDTEAVANLAHMTTALREWLGIMVYRLTGRL